jgi:hypothetical protein
MELVAILYAIGLIIAAVFLVLLFSAPIKLYAIHRELIEIKEQSRVQTRLLGLIANVSPDSPGSPQPESPAQPEPTRRSFLSDDSSR